MTWVKLDDGFFRNSKARAAGVEARALFVASLCYCAGTLTDGFVPTDDLALIAAEAQVKPAVHKRLVDTGLWEPADGGWLVHDYLLYNPTAEKVKAEREAARKRADAARARAGARTAERAGARAPAPNGERSGVRAEVPSSSSSTYISSSTNGCRGTKPTDDDELDETDPKVAAARRTAKDDLARRERELGPVGNRDAWLTQATRRRLHEPALEAPRLYADWQPPDLPDGTL